MSLYYTLPITGVIEIISPTTFASSFAYMSGKRLIVVCKQLIVSSFRLSETEMENKLEFHVICSHLMNGIKIKSTGTPHLNMTKKLPYILN